MRRVCACARVLRVMLGSYERQKGYFYSKAETEKSEVESIGTGLFTSVKSYPNYCLHHGYKWLGQIVSSLLPAFPPKQHRDSPPIRITDC